MDKRTNKMIRCPSCGAQNSQSAVFCTLCLTRFDEPAAEAEEAGEETGRTPDSIAPDAPASQDDDLALPPDLELEIARPAKDVDLTRVWVRAAIVFAVALLSLAVSLGVLAILISRQQGKQQITEPQAAPAPPVVTNPEPQTAPAPPAAQQAPGSPAAHPDVSLTPPTGWTMEGTADDIVMRSPEASATIEVRSWQRVAGGNYRFVNGDLTGITETSARDQMATQLLAYLHSNAPPAGARTAGATIAGQPAVTADVSDVGSNSFKRAYGVIHGDWTYLFSGSAPVQGQNTLTSGMDAVLQSVSFKR